MRKSLTFLTAASVAALATPAMAQSADDNDFTGPRVEAIVGYDISRAGSDIDDDLNEDNDQSIDGALYGIALGYDIDLGSVVVGAEAELTDSTAQTDIEDEDFEGVGLGEVETGRDLYLGARLGFKASDNALIYAKGGYTNAKYNIEADGVTTDSDIDTDGYRIGAGAEYSLGGKSYVKLEYRYSNYSEAEIDFEDADVVDTERFDIDTDRHQVVVGYGLRF